jgi:alkylated DNA repair dioxygenase AlkB
MSVEKYPNSTLNFPEVTDAMRMEFDGALDRVHSVGMGYLDIITPELSEQLAQQLAQELPSEDWRTESAGRLRQYNVHSPTTDDFKKLTTSLLSTAKPQQPSFVEWREEYVTTNVAVYPEGKNLEWHKDEDNEGIVAILTLTNEANFFYSGHDKRIHALKAKPGRLVLVEGGRRGVWHSVSQPINPGNRTILGIGSDYYSNYEYGEGARSRARIQSMHEERALELEAKKQRFGGRRVIWDK